MGCEAGRERRAGIGRGRLGESNVTGRRRGSGQAGAGYRGGLRQTVEAGRER